SVLHRQAPPSDDERALDPLLAVCKEVGAVLRLDIRPAPTTSASPGRRDPLEDIVRASRIRKRRVALRATWWQGDNAPLVASLAEDGRPVALLPTGPSSYVLHDVVARSWAPVTPTVAARLDPLAYRFYRTLPARALRVRDLLRFCVRGNLRDLS